MTAPASQTGREMSERESRSFLAANDNGVLSLGVESRGYGFPISYSYGEDTDRVVLGFVAAPESKKREFAAETEQATFTVYDHEDIDAWKSVIVEGPIRLVNEDDAAHRVPDLFWEGDEDQVLNLDDFERTWYELRIESISGRHSSQ